MELCLTLIADDFTSAEAGNATRWWCHELSMRGLRATVLLSGQFVRTQKVHHRHEVVDAIAKHELGYRGNVHPAPPHHPVELANRSLEEGVSWVLRQEAAGIAACLESFGRLPVVYGPDPNLWAPASLIAMASLGLPVACVRVPWIRKGWYCGLMIKPPDLVLDDALSSDDALERHAEMFALMRRMLPPHACPTFLVSCSALVTGEPWWRPFERGAAPSLDSLPAPALLDAEETERRKDRAKRWLDGIQRFGDIRWIDHATFYADRSAGRRGLHRLLVESDLRMGEAGRLPVERPKPVRHPLPSPSDELRFDAAQLPHDFTASQLVGQAHSLLWTYAPLQRRAS